MKNFFFIAQACAISLLFVSCSGEVKKVPIPEVEITGNIGGEYADKYLKIDGGTYSFSLDGETINISLPIKTIKVFQNQLLEEIGYFHLAILDSKGAYIVDLGGNEIEIELKNADEINKLLASKVGDKNTLSFSYDAANAKDIFDKIHSFDVWIELEVSKGRLSSDSGTSSWDDILDSYEKITDQYISLHKKVVNGDISVLNEYQSVLEKVEELGKKLENAEDELTTHQAVRFSKIATKFASAATGM